MKQEKRKADRNLFLSSPDFLYTWFYSASLCRLCCRLGVVGPREYQFTHIAEEAWKGRP